ncbi:tyrosine-type recombinase/integrase [Sphaerisporangium sp. NPDC051011]|uniref:tyrosine-type recombinase/integrase n=1 Tax=Sphaerisporangium sp. NPDC051011 TaxID=3155792 RepID=UPI00340B909A
MASLTLRTNLPLAPRGSHGTGQPPAELEAIRTVAGLGDMRFHDLRHTCVTLLLNLGVPPQVVRDIVGHSDIEVTMTIYAHASLDDKRQALGKLGDALHQAN